MNTNSVYPATPFILVVDNDTSTRMLVRGMIEQEGYQLAEVANLEQALSAYTDREPDIVLLNAEITEIDSLTDYTQLQTLSVAARTPMLIMATQEEQAAINRILGVGTFECIAKPIQRSLLHQHLRLLGQQLQYQRLEQFNQELQAEIKGFKQTEQALQAKLQHSTLHDALTGLPNRQAFLQRLQQAIARTQQQPDYVFALLFLDLDRFRVINECLGHDIGDQLLIKLAQRLEFCLKSKDIVARLGGDEFIILLESISNTREATAVTEYLQQELALPFNLEQHEIFTTASIGIALSTLGYNRSEDMLRDAEATMYRAKALGKARYEVFEPALHHQAMALLQLETDLRRALHRQEFQIYYQPIVTINSGKIKGFEALVRWFHPQRGFVSPVDFIPIAEETGLIIPLGWWIMREACRQTHLWQEQFPTKQQLTISVNLSAKQFQQPDLIQQIDQILHETGLESGSLVLEITESAIMEDIESASVMLSKLRTLGIRLSIDDFGTGYSSLSYLHRLPIDILKIDRSFVKDVDFDAEKIEIIRTVVALAWNLGMNVVAEGVETKKQMYQLRSLRCEFGQGYLFSPALDAEAAAAFNQADIQGEKTLVDQVDNSTNTLTAVS